MLRLSGVAVSVAGRHFVQRNDDAAVVAGRLAPLPHCSGGGGHRPARGAQTDGIEAATN